MSTQRFTQTIPAHKLPRGENGRALCRICSVEVPKGRRTFCSDRCSDEYLIRTRGSYMRFKLHERDKGVCAVCGLDTDALAIRLRAMGWLEQSQYLHDHNFNSGTSLWEADHIVPVVEGGGECGLDNYRTLCVPCHKQATAELARRRAEERQKLKPTRIRGQLWRTEELASDLSLPRQLWLLDHLDSEHTDARE